MSDCLAWIGSSCALRAQGGAPPPPASWLPSGVPSAPILPSRGMSFNTPAPYVYRGRLSSGRPPPPPPPPSRGTSWSEYNAKYAPLRAQESQQLAAMGIPSAPPYIYRGPSSGRPSISKPPKGNSGREEERTSAEKKKKTKNAKQTPYVYRGPSSGRPSISQGSKSDKRDAEKKTKKQTPAEKKRGAEKKTSISQGSKPEKKRDAEKKKTKKQTPAELDGVEEDGALDSGDYDEDEGESEAEDEGEWEAEDEGEWEGEDEDETDYSDESESDESDVTPGVS